MIAQENYYAMIYIQYRFLVEAEYAYGKLGCPPRIPPQTTILFDVELLGFADSSVLNFYNDNLEDRRQLNFDELIFL